MSTSEIARPPIRQNVRVIACRMNVNTGAEGLAGSFLDCWLTVIPADPVFDGGSYESVDVRVASFEMYERVSNIFRSGAMFELAGEWQPGGYVAIAVDGK